MGYKNKSNVVQTIDAFSRVLVLLYRTFICSFVLLLLKSSSDSHTFLFQTLIYRNFGQKRRFWSISTRLWRTDRPTDGRTDTPSYRDARTHLKTSKLNSVCMNKSCLLFLRQFEPLRAEMSHIEPILRQSESIWGNVSHLEGDDLSQNTPSELRCFNEIEEILKRWKRHWNCLDTQLDRNMLQAKPPLGCLILKKKTTIEVETVVKHLGLWKYTKL